MVEFDDGVWRGWGRGRQGEEGRVGEVVDGEVVGAEKDKGARRRSGRFTRNRNVVLAVC